MKSLINCCIALSFACGIAEGQLPMNSGDSFTYEFQFGPGELAPGIGYSYAFFAPRLSGVDPGDSVRIEVFEQSPKDSFVLCSQLYEQDSFCKDPLGNWWTDRQGAVRISVLSGSVQLEELYMGREEPITSGSH